ncbi:MAG: energy transducer TonB [Porphyrobacter sp.]|nr:energy transducer TonB [Porphyrobacter sp.]
MSGKFPLLPEDTRPEAAVSPFAALREGIMERVRRLNWIAVGVTVALEGVILAALLSLGVGSFIKPQPEKLTMLDVRPSSPEAAPPSPPKPVEQELTPVIQPQPKVAEILPQPVIEVPRMDQQPAAETQAPVAPAPAPAPAAPVPTAATGPVRVSNLNTNLLSGPPPAYPNISRRKKEEGTVVLRLVIAEDGKVADVSVSRSSGFPALDDAAVAAVRKWRWSPTVKDGRAVSITGLVQIPFVLKKS